MTRGLFLAGFSLFLACSHEAPPAEPSKAPARVSLATIETRNGKVTLLGGREEIRVRLRDADGNVVAEEASLDELYTRDPATWLIVTRAIAGYEGDGKTYLDASR